MDYLPDSATLLLFVATSFALLVIPGPAVMYVVARSLEQGWRSGVISSLGLLSGAVVHILLVAAGLATLLQSSYAAFAIIRLAGAAYLGLLGARMILAGARLANQQTVATVPPWRVFRQGVLVNLSNPKAMLFFFAFLPQFVEPARGAIPGQLVALGCVFLVCAFINDTAWAAFAGWLTTTMHARPGFAMLQRYIAGSVLIILGFVAAVSVL